MFIYDILSGPDLNSYTPGKGEGGNDLVAGIQDIMKREYWQRIWINQEIALAKEVTLMCGTKSVGLDHFEATFSAVDECNRLHRYVNSEARGFAKGLDDHFWVNLPLNTRERFRNDASVPLIDLLYTNNLPPGRPLYAASDPRDLIFGLLGIITDNDVLKLQVDYRKTTAEVFTATTRALISRGDNDNGMSAYRFDFCIPREGNAGNSLPSWVPDWQKIGQVGYGPLMRPGGMNATEIFDATGSIPIPTLPRDTNDDSFGIIRRAGCRVDIVTDVLQPHRSFSDGYTENIEEWLSRIMSFFGLGPVTSPGEDYIWRTILSQEQYSNVNPSISEDNAALVRMIMRGCNIDVKLLTTAQKEFLDRFEDPIVKEESFAPERDWFVYATQVIEMLQETGAMLEYTLFKTMKGMLGLGYLTIKPGDVVTLLWGLPSPIILRQQNDQNFDGLTFQGCAYVDQIMHGEFLQTNPTHEVFTIY